MCFCILLLAGVLLSTFDLSGHRTTLLSNRYFHDSLSVSSPSFLFAVVALYCTRLEVWLKCYSLLMFIRFCCSYDFGACISYPLIRMTNHGGKQQCPTFSLHLIQLHQISKAERGWWWWSGRLNPLQLMKAGWTLSAVLYGIAAVGLSSLEGA